MRLKKYVATVGALLTVAALAQAVLSTSAVAYKVPKPCKVPHVVGMQLAKAENAITKANCQVGSVTTQVSKKPKDHVIAQNPPPGGPGPVVNLTVSLGQPPPGAKCHVPNVVGKSQAKAQSALVKANCGVGKVTQKKSKKPKGQVLSQNPGAGTTAAVGTKVKLTVSKGKKKKK